MHYGVHGYHKSNQLCTVCILISLVTIQSEKCPHAYILIYKNHYIAMHVDAGGQ